MTRWITVLAILLSLASPLLHAQTPSPIPQWQYSAGILLEDVFEPTLPEWRVVLGAASAVQPVYSGARADRVQGGPVINIRYKDLAFLSLGEGIGVNVLRGDQYRVGMSLGYDLGRRESQDRTNLHGMGNISIAPSVKVFGSWMVSRAFPLVIEADVRRIVGGANGALADLGFYLPLPGSSQDFMMFFGPSITWANRRYLQNEFGVTPDQSVASGHPIFLAASGTHSIGLGLSATRFITQHWLINFDAAVSRLRGSAEDSPLTERQVQRTLALSFDYRW